VYKRQGEPKAAVAAAVASPDTSTFTVLMDQKFKAQEDRMEQLLKQTSAPGNVSRVSGGSDDIQGKISRVAGDSADIYGGSIWALKGIEIPSPNSGNHVSLRTGGAIVNSSLLMDYTLVVAPQVVPDVPSFDSAAFAVGVGHVGSFQNGNVEASGGSEGAAINFQIGNVEASGGSEGAAVTFQNGNVEASGGSEGAAVFFEIDSDATHSMHGSAEFCQTRLVNFDSTRRLQLTVANGDVIYGEGCGRLVEGGLLTEEVWYVPSIGDRGVLSVWPATAHGISCTLGPGGVTFSKDQEVIAQGFRVPVRRNFEIRFNLKNVNTDVANNPVAVSVPILLSNVADTSVGEPPPLIGDFRGVCPN
jgi:hypothetical protein